MRKLLSILLFCCSLLVMANERPKVAVVLAGGGARGLAHISALKAIEEAGIPVDMVIGNSMGSIVAGLYAVGYTPDEMNQIVQNVDWMKLLLDNPDYGNPLLTARKANENFLIRVSLNYARLQSATGKGGVISGRNISRLFESLTKGLPDSIDFNDLPIPYACVATDAITGQLVELHSGSLVQAMRSSMSIPGAFTPIQWGDSLLLVDGFVKNNFPVDVAKRMGADIIVGVDITAQGTENLVQKYSNMMELASHLFDFYSDSLYQQNIKDCDVYIPIDATGFTSASFTTEAIDTLLERGKDAARRAMPQLHNLSVDLLSYDDKLAEGGSYQNTDNSQSDRQKQQYSVWHNVRAEVPADTLASLNFGANFNNEEYASALIAANMILPFRQQISSQIMLRLGQRLCGGIGFSHNLKAGHSMHLNYLFQHRNMDYYYRGNKAAAITSNHHRIQASFNRSGRRLNTSIGVMYDMHRYTDVLIRRDSTVIDFTPDLSLDRFLTYYFRGEYNTLDSQHFPTRGTEINVRGELLTTNFVTYDHYAPIPIFSGFWQMAIPASHRLVLLPNVQGRIAISGDSDLPPALRNVVGGYGRGVAVDHQLKMAGVAYMEEISADAVMTVGTGAQFQVFGNHYLVGAADGASFTYHTEDLLDHNNIFWGADLGYSYKSVFGPIKLLFHYSSRTECFRCTLSGGWAF